MPLPVPFSVNSSVKDFDPRSLPALSPLAGDLLALDIEDGKAEKLLIKVIESEPQLSVRLISMANSAAFSPAGQKSDSITTAVRRIGLARSSQLAIAMLFGNPLQSTLPVALTEGLWTHALSMAAAAQEIARYKRTENPGSAYLAGLVHDLGYMAEELCEPGALRRSIETSESDHITLEQAEQRSLGVSHAVLTVKLLTFWDAPNDIIAALETHHNLDIDSGSLAAIVYGAEKLARYIEITDILYDDSTSPFPGMSIDREGLNFLFDQQLDLQSEDVALLIGRIIDQVESYRECARAMNGGH